MQMVRYLGTGQFDTLEEVKTKDLLTKMKEKPAIKNAMKFSPHIYILAAMVSVKRDFNLRHAIARIWTGDDARKVEKEVNELLEGKNSPLKLL